MLSEVVLRQVGEDGTHIIKRVGFVTREVVGNAGANRMGFRAAEFFHAHVFARHRFDDVGARHKHLARFVDHDNKVGESG